MITVFIDDQKKGAPEILELLRILGFVNSYETTTEKNLLQLKRQKLLKHPQKYNPLALAGAAGDFVLDLAKIRKGWTKMK